MIESYSMLHSQGVAVSIETWHDLQLVGGLYGLKLGSVFCGESMFHTEPNASKAAFWALCALCRASGIELIDGQLPNPHLASLGASTLPRAQFLEALPHLILKTVDWTLSSPASLDSVDQVVFDRFCD